MSEENISDIEEVDNEEFDVEEEKGLSEELTDINEPFDPKDIDIQAVQTTMDTLIKRLQHEEIDLNPEFQRAANLWKPQFMSRLRSEEHTSELQSRPHLVCRLLLEKKK